MCVWASKMNGYKDTAEPMLAQALQHTKSNKMLVGLSPTLECSVQGLDEEVDAILFSTLLFTSIGEVSNALSEGGDQRQICSG